jgi:hypothetical protein
MVPLAWFHWASTKCFPMYDGLPTQYRDADNEALTGGAGAPSPREGPPGERQDVDDEPDLRAQEAT